MKNHKFWWAFIAFLVVWSLFEIYPPSNQSLIQEFKKDSDPAKQDGAYRNIVSNAEFLQLKNPDPSQEFAVLTNAIGTNDIQGYFPYYNVKGEERPTYAILNILQKKAAGKIHLGLDLQGGTEFQVSLETNRVVSTDTNLNAVNASEERQRLVTQASEILRNRVDALGVAEPVITPSGDKIDIQLPGLSQSAQDEARQNIQKAAYLEFRLVNSQSEEYLTQNPPLIPPGYEVLHRKQKAADGSAVLVPVLVEKKAAYGLTGANIKSAHASRDPSGNPEIEVEFDADGAKKFGKLTTDHWKGSEDPQRMAIVLDGEIVTDPAINEPILSGRCSISGAMDINEAISDANALENPLEAPVHIDSVSQVDPTLGKDSIKSGLYSAVAGTLLVVVFMAFYYHRCGVIADIAMLLNLVISLGIMCYMQTTFTLPGIAGVVLTVGMAVDANVLIYERLREEMALGKSMRSALSAAYSRAFGTIFDSHTTTLISAIVLWNMGTGPVKGFGATLTIGVALSLFTALVVTRLIFDFLLSRGWLNKVGMLHIIKNLDWDFMKWTKATYVFSALVIIVGLGWGIHRGKDIMGPDFAGGDAVTLSFAEKVDVDKLRSALTPKLGSQPGIQYQRGVTETLHVVVPEGKAGIVTNTLPTAFPTAGFKVIGSTSVGASVGEGIQKSALIASFVALFCIMVYVALRYEFSFAIGAVLAVIHDILITLGIFFLSGKQLSAPMVAAILTIIGFSLNDKVVIFDRIREDLKLAMRGTFREIINKAINQTLSRTIITSGTVFLSTMALFLFGGGVINDFAFTFLVGIVTGTYSSIYIACALVLWWHKGERPKSGTQVSMQPANVANAPKAAPATARP